MVFLTYTHAYYFAEGIDPLQGPATDNNFLLNGPKTKCFKKLSRIVHIFFILKENCFGQHRQQNKIDIVGGAWHLMTVWALRTIQVHFVIHDEVCSNNVHYGCSFKCDPTVAKFIHYAHEHHHPYPIESIYCIY